MNRTVFSACRAVWGPGTRFKSLGTVERLHSTRCCRPTISCATNPVWPSSSYIATPFSCSQSLHNSNQGNTNRLAHTISQRQLADLEENVTSAVGRNVKDPILQKDLASLGWFGSRCVAISDNGESVQLLLRLPTLLHPGLDQLKEKVASEATKVISDWKHRQGKTQGDNTMTQIDGTFLSLLDQVNVQAIATSPTPLMAQLVEDPDEVLRELGPGLEHVAHVVAVYSCKGGVGKSTVAVNLAYELARKGGRVGLLDLDLYGPSLPILVNPKDKAVRRSNKAGKGMVYPIEHEGVRLLSLGFVNTNSGVQGSGMNNGAAIMRGPLVVKVVAQLLKGTDWGELDVLILDLPPGTGDVQLAVCQDLALSGAVAVTTPSKLATVDTKKGIEMFTSLGVPTLAVVENMSYFMCEGGSKHYPFGRATIDEPIISKDVPTVRFPISCAANDASESGEPMCLVRPDSAKDELETFEELASVVSRELLRIHYGQTESKEFVAFPQDNLKEMFSVASIQLTAEASAPAHFKLRLYSPSGAIEKRVHPAGLRARDPKTGDIIEDSPFRNQLHDEPKRPDPHHKADAGNNKTGKTSPSLSPVKVERKGRYGFAVQWGDGATIIYSKRCLAKASGGLVVEEKKEENVL